jgi:hypothetical protein
VQQRGAQRLGVEPHPGADLRDADRVDDEVLARLPALVGVVHARVDECLLDPLAVDGLRRVLGVLFDDREQIPQQTPLGRRQLRPIDRLVVLGMLDAIDRRASGGDPVVARVTVRGGSASAIQSLAGSLALLRNLRPSSYRCA